MRKGVLFFLLFVVLLVSGLVYFFADRWVERAIEISIESVTGAKAEVDDLHLSFIPIEITWKKLQIANPYNTWTNAIETGEVKFGVDFNQLLRKKIIIEKIDINGLQLLSKRTTDGALPEDERKKSTLYRAEKSFIRSYRKAFDEMMGNIPRFDINDIKKNFNPDSLIKLLDLKTYYFADSLRLKVSETADQWNEIVSQYERNKNKLIEQIEEIKKIEPKSLNNAQNILAAIEKADRGYKTLKQIKTEYEERFNKIKSEVTYYRNAYDTLRRISLEDYERLKQLARLPDIKSPRLAPIIIGNEIQERAKNYIAYAELINASIQKYKPEPDYEKPPRFEGQDIEFPVEGTYPDFWIKEIRVTGGNPNSRIFVGKGTIENISDNQNLTGKPITFKLEGELSNNRHVFIAGTIERRNFRKIDKYRIELRDVPVGKVKLGTNKFLPTEINNAFLSTKADIFINENDLNVILDNTFTNMILFFEKQPESIVERIVYNTLNGIKKLSTTLRFWIDDGKYDISLSTNLDEEIAAGIRRSIGQEVEMLKGRLKERFDQIVAAKRAELEKIYNEKVVPIEERINQYRELVENYDKLIEEKKKELNKRLEEEKKGFIEKQLNKLIK
ncbi:TIGR03545 family protein [Melioribacter sp. OK-6-Me]|uniref:TIGR03545 family protein n=1 Tax=unclassified Melioribacter TaxID=2627329 RepID=UPI003ED95983